MKTTMMLILCGQIFIASFGKIYGVQNSRAKQLIFIYLDFIFIFIWAFGHTPTVRSHITALDLRIFSVKCTTNVEL